MSYELNHIFSSSSFSCINFSVWCVHGIPYFAFIFSICLHCMSWAFYTQILYLWLHSRNFCCDVTSILIKDTMCICFASLSSFHMFHSTCFHLKLFKRNSNLRVCDHIFHHHCFQQIGVSSSFLKVLNRFSVWCKADKS